MTTTTQQKLIDSARFLIQTRGYNGFSYADVAEQVQVRKASIHHHFPAKSDLARAVVEESRAIIAAQTRSLDSTFDPEERLRVYTDYWERCIADASAPFCVAGMLATEISTLPADLADHVRAHFQDLTNWLEAVLTKGADLGLFTLHGPARLEAESFMAMVYGAMLTARASGEPRVFADIVEHGLGKLLRPTAV